MKIALRSSILFIVYLFFNILVRVIFLIMLIVALLNNVKVDERFVSPPGIKIRKKLTT